MFTKETHTNTQLIKCLETELTLEEQGNNWLKIFNSIKNS